jgi:hypothetical protein
MKSLKLFLCLAVMFIASLCFADTAAAATGPQLPTWVADVVQFLANLPVVGHFIVLILAVIAGAAVIITPLTALLMAIEKVTGWTQLDGVNAFLNKILPYFQMFSNFPTPAPAPVVVSTTTQAVPNPAAPASTTPPSST